MIVYRTAHREAQPKPRLRAISRDLRSWIAGVTLDIDSARDILIELGIVEAGISDALNPEVDTVSSILGALRAASHSAGRMFVASWLSASVDEQRSLASDALRNINALDAIQLPETIRVGTPEGYAYYSLYPEQYAAAAMDIVPTLRPRNAVCIGVRGIGTSLSAVVSAVLEHHGCNVSSYTVRPHGHPFDREIRIAPALRTEWMARRDALFLVVDEGPGLSGSSLASVARALGEIDVPDAQIVLLPSWAPDGMSFVSDAARDQWRRHRKFVATFEDVLLRDARLTSGFASNSSSIDLSAGKWRNHLFGRSVWPAVQPSHERRKYLLRRDNRPALLLKFAGLGQTGRDRLERAERIAGAGFGPAPVGLQHGFLATELLDADPLSTGSVDTPVLDRIANYLAFVAREFADDSASSGVREDQLNQLREMIEVNTSEMLGDSALRGVAQLLSAGVLPTERPVALDGRMFPHEWLRCGDALLKVDALDHHDDHFFPGSQDIAWDLAATAVEFELDPAAERYMLHRYGALARDAQVAARMPFYRVAYLAHRGGYATLASQTLAGCEDGSRWRALASKYQSQLRGAIAAMSNAA